VEKAVKVVPMTGKKEHKTKTGHDYRWNFHQFMDKAKSNKTTKQPSSEHKTLLTNSSVV